MQTLTKVYEDHNVARQVVTELEMAGIPHQQSVSWKIKAPMLNMTMVDQLQEVVPKLD